VLRDPQPGREEPSQQQGRRRPRDRRGDR
jgi:hypothetical protein